MQVCATFFDKTQRNNYNTLIKETSLTCELTFVIVDDGVDDSIVSKMRRERFYATLGTTLIERKCTAHTEGACVYETNKRKEISELKDATGTLSRDTQNTADQKLAHDANTTSL
jgi:hypothetical protein